MQKYQDSIVFHSNIPAFWKAGYIGQLAVDKSKRLCYYQPLCVCTEQNKRNNVFGGAFDGAPISLHEYQMSVRDKKLMPRLNEPFIAV